MDKMEESVSGNELVKVEESEVMDIKLEELHHSIDIKEENLMDESEMDEQLRCGYYLVLFNEDDSFAVVPCSWVIQIEESGTYNCFWPGVTNNNMIRNCVPPKLNWKCYGVTIQGRFDSYVDADLAMEDFAREDENSYNFLCNNWNTYGHLLEETIKRQFSDDEDDEKVEFQLLPTKKKCTRIKTTDNGQFNQSTENDEASDPSNTEDQNRAQTVAEDIEKKIEPMSSHSYTKKLFQELSHLKYLVQRTLSKVSLIEQKLENSEGKTKTYRFAHMTPVQSVEHLQSIENSTRDLEDSKAELKMWFLNIGGVNPKDFIVGCLKRFFSNKLGISCSWTGQRNNYELRNLNVMATMLDACKELFPNSTDKEYEMCVREWFRNCMQRYKREYPLQEDSQ